MAAAVCRKGGCGEPADPASPGGEWCAVHGAFVAHGQAAALAASAAPSRAYHKSH